MIQVLLIDDDLITNNMNERVILKIDSKIEVIHATNGKEGLNFLNQTASAGKPNIDLILLDIKMAVMDGFQFLDKYKSLPPSHKAKNLYALTSSASFYDLVKLKEYTDVIGHIDKPLTTYAFKRIIESILY